MNQEEIKKIIPHRDNMLLVEEAEVVDEVTSKGKITIKGDEFFLKGHFPGNPVVPGVTPFFTKMDNVKFKNTVRPGDTLESVCTLTRSRGAFHFVSAKGYVDGKLCVSAEFSFALVDNENANA